MTNADFLPPPKYVKVSFDLDPATNAIDSLSSLNRIGNVSLSEWVVETAASLSPEQKITHELAMEGLGSYLYELQTERSWPSFPALIDYIAAQDPVTFRDDVLNLLLEHHSKGEMPEPPERPTREELLGSLDKFLSWIEYLWGEYNPSRTLFTQLHTLLHEPERLRDRVVAHFRMMWHGYLEPEWQRNLPMLTKVIEAYRKLDFSNMTAADALRAVTGREMPVRWMEKTETIDEIVFIPSPHLGPYLVMLGGALGQCKVIFGARMPMSQVAPKTEHTLGRSELLIRLNALTDDTRLRIIQLLTQEDELCAQDIIAKLELSQSSVSRHLTQLVSTGIITERRRDVAKCYSLNPTRIGETLSALTSFMQRKI